MHSRRGERGQPANRIKVHLAEGAREGATYAEESLAGQATLDGHGLLGDILSNVATTGGLDHSDLVALGVVRVTLAVRHADILHHD